MASGDAGFRTHGSSRSFSQQIEEWAELTRRKKMRVVGEATAEVFRLALRPQRGVRYTGGSYREGFVPEDTGQLLESAEATIDGELVGVGEDAWRSVPSRMNMGAVSYLNFSAPYARFVEYGTRNMAGRFFVTNASQQWWNIVQDVVDDIIAESGG